MSETIKTFTPITVEQAFKLAADGEHLCFSNNGGDSKQWTDSYELESIHLNRTEPFKPYHCSSFKYCATVTELDPCKAPDGCPELEPWMAYVGDQWGGKEVGRNEPSIYWIFGDKWESHEGHCGLGQNRPYAIDVRTAWAQEHFPEHCQIRNYQEPDAFEEFIKGEELNWRGSAEYSLARRAYELGQQNPKTK